MNLLNSLKLYRTTTSYSEFGEMYDATDTATHDALVAKVQERLSMDDMEVTTDYIEFIASETSESIANDCKGDVMSSEWCIDGFWACVEETVRANY